MIPFEPRMCRSPRDWEQAACDWMISWGFEDASLTDVGPDDGIDVTAGGAIAQVKSWMTPIGIADVQRLKGAAHDGREALFFSLMEYTEAARRFAEEASVRLFRFSGYDGSVEAANAGAVSLIREANASSAVESVVVSELTKAAGLPGFVIIEVRDSGNRYVQCAPPIRLESVGRTFIDEDNPLTPQQLSRLVAIGWPPEEEDESNFVYPLPLSLESVDWPSVLDPHTQEHADYFGLLAPGSSYLGMLASVMVRTLVEVHGAESPEQLIVHVVKNE